MRLAVFLISAWALVAGSFSARAQEVCGGIAGIGCDDAGEFCLLADGECCCDFQGVCTEIPEVCPAVYAPVCGCDGATYSNRCEAWKASVSVAHACECEGIVPPPASTVVVTEFTGAHQLFWQPLPEAYGYNVYLDAGETAPPKPVCLYSPVRESSVLLQGDPGSDGLWTFFISSLRPSGEGSLGVGSACDPRQAAAPCTCTLPADGGPCDGVCPRWFHNAQTGECEQFTWGCCGGNANNFQSAGDCVAACLDPCTQPAVQGDCDAVITRWYHNVLTGECETFTWGGCGGNANNFPSEVACAAACLDPCQLPADPGPCDGVCPRWFYNAETGQCEEFIWGCCGGNANNFPSEAACTAACSAADDTP